MRRELLFAGLSLLALGGCNCGSPAPLKLDHQVGTFQVQVTSVTTPGGGALQSGSGTASDPYPFPFGNVVMHVKAQALDERGKPYADLNRPVAIRVTPGDIDPNTRSLVANGGVVEGDIQAGHVFGAVSVWVVDGPPDSAYADGGQPISTGPDAGSADAGYDYSNAAGVSQTLYFKRPSLVDIQRQPLCDPGQSFSPPVATCQTNDDCYDAAHRTAYTCFQNTCLGSCDNRLSPLTGDFIDVEQAYTGADAGMIVTAITQDGFYVEDLNGQKLNDPANGSSPNWQALPGHFGQIFAYTYSAPTNLYVGDHLISLTGSVQEFSGDTQLNFPGWVKVDAEPTPAFVPAPTPITLALCGNTGSHRAAYDLCGYYNSNMMLESLEAAPVVVDNVVPTSRFVNCDANGNGRTPLMANSTRNGWYCFPDDAEFSECACDIACVTGEAQPLPDGGSLDYGHLPDGGLQVCTEKSGFTSFGQWEVALPDEHYPDGGLSASSYGTRINVVTRDALSAFNPLDLERPEYQGITFRVAGMLNQVQAGRPRWLIYARDPDDVCCHELRSADGQVLAHCPTGVKSCESIGGR